MFSINTRWSSSIMPSKMSPRSPFLRSCATIHVLSPPYMDSIPFSSISTHLNGGLGDNFTKPASQTVCIARWSNSPFVAHVPCEYSPSPLWYGTICAASKSRFVPVHSQRIPPLNWTLAITRLRNFFCPGRDDGPVPTWERAWTDCCSVLDISVSALCGRLETRTSSVQGLFA